MRYSRWDYYITSGFVTWSEIQNYTCKPVLLDSAQAICVKKSHLQLLAIASLQYILLSTLRKMSKVMPKIMYFDFETGFIGISIP